jgi:hypothetical protein
MPQHGHRKAASAEYVEEESESRFGFLTMETALVLGVVALIVLGSFLVHLTLPSKHANTTVVGDKKVTITTVGKGGVEPGAIQPRNIPVVVPTPVVTKPLKTPKPRKTVSPLGPTGTPTPTPTKGGGIVTPGGGGGGGGGQCTVLILCKPGQKPSQTPSPQPVATDPAQPPVSGSPVPQ